MSHSTLNPLDDESTAVVGRRIKNIFAGSIGNLIEWYDFYVYNAFALYFSSQMSASNDPTVQYLTTFGIYAVGFFIRPVGGLLLGNYADRAGRRAALTLSVVLMCAGSAMIAVIPGYSVIGIGAPILLLVARLLQGLSLGGEYATSATYLSEIAVSKHRGFYSSFQYVTLLGGQVLAALVLLVMQQVLTGAQLESWGWRVPFVLGALCAVYGLYLRRNLDESPEFLNARKTQTESPLRGVFRHPKELFIVFGLTMGGTTAFYTFTAYMPTFLTNTVHLSKEQANTLSFLSLLFAICIQPLFGAISDRVGRKPVLLWFGIMGTLCTVWIMTTLAASTNLVSIVLLLMFALVIVSGYTSINAVVKAELFPAGVRALGVGLPYALAASIFGGTAPLIGLAFKRAGHEEYFFYYVTALIAASLVIYAIMPDTKKTSRIQGP